jgi:ABC-type nitrate/sulfonate/bicarbonate transport system substrate-binding protein
MAMSAVKSFSTLMLLILAAVVQNSSAVAGFIRHAPSARMEHTLVAQKAQEQKASKPERIVAAIPVRALANVPLLVGVKKGFYRQEGLEIDIVQMGSTPAITGMMTGDVTVDFHTSAIRAPVAGRPIRMIGYMVDRLNWHLYAKPEIKKVEDLKGKVLAVTDIGGNVTYISQIVLEKHGLGGFGKDAEMFPTGSMQSSTLALLARQVDAALVGTEMGIKAEAKGFHVIARASDYVPLGLGGISTSLDTLKNRPDTIKRFLRGTIKSLQYIKADKNKSEAADFFAHFLNLSRSDAELIYAQSKECYSPNGSISREGLQFEISLLVQQLGLKKQISVDEVADFRLLREIQAELGLK